MKFKLYQIKDVENCKYAFGGYFYTVEELIKKTDQEKKLIELRVEVDE